MTERAWWRLHDPVEPVHGLAAEQDGKLLGIVHYLYHRSTWSVGPYCYLQDLFTVGWRGAGDRTHPHRAVHEKAKADGTRRVRWLTHETNEAASALYGKIATRTGFIHYKQVI